MPEVVESAMQTEGVELTLKGKIFTDSKRKYRKTGAKVHKKDKPERNPTTHTMDSTRGKFPTKTYTAGSFKTYAPFTPAESPRSFKLFDM